MGQPTVGSNPTPSAQRRPGLIGKNPDVRCATAIVRDWKLVAVEGDDAPMRAASLVKPVLAHIALALVADVDEPILDDITVRHVLSHTTGLPNWRTGADLEPLRPPGERWGYSGEGFVLLQGELERRTGRPIDAIAGELVFGPLGMADTRFDPPEPGFHGSRPLLTTAADYGRFLAHVLTITDERWQPQCRIDDELAWGLGWGLELGEPGVRLAVGPRRDPEPGRQLRDRLPFDGRRRRRVSTDDPNGRERYRAIVDRELPGDHASLRVEHNPTWIALCS